MNTDYQNKTEELWNKILGKAELRVSRMEFKTCFENTFISNVFSDEIHITCNSKFVKDNLDKKYKMMLLGIIEEVTGDPLDYKTIVEKKVEEKKEMDTKKETSSKIDLFASEETIKEQQDSLIRTKQIQANLTPKYTFNNYIMGSNNNLAYAVAKAVAEKPGERYNPVFIYSNVGLGKTHLIQSIGNEIIQKKPGMRVIYTTGENFMNELIEAIQEGKGKMNKFRDKFRNADVFLIDDIQMIIGKDTTQEEFFHTYNALYMAGKQIVITSDRPPKEFKTLADRITSRFNSGMIVDIQEPDIEMRSAILRRRRDAMGDTVSNEIIDFIAETVNSNVRELEGAYMQIVALNMTAEKPLTTDEVARKLNKTIETAQNNAPINNNQILRAVCQHYSVTMADIKGKRRNKEVVVPRQIAMYLMKGITNTPFSAIGEILGGRDHTTIMHGVGKIEKEFVESSQLKQEIATIKQNISNF